MKEVHEMNKVKVYSNLEQDFDQLIFLASMMKDANELFLETGVGLESIKVNIGMIETLIEIMYNDIDLWDGEENE